MRSSKEFASNANLDDFAQKHASSQAAIEVTSNYYHIHDMLSECLEMTVAYPSKLKLTSDTDKKTDHVDAKQLARMLRSGSIAESHVPSDEVREAHAQVRGRQSLVENRTEYANEIHGLLSDHGITEEVKPLSVEGARVPCRTLALDAVGHVVSVLSRHY